MLRKIAVSLAALGALSANHAQALGLGEVTIHSALNQPLQAEIELLQLRGLDKSQIISDLADRDEFYLAGLEPSALLNDMRFEVRLEGGKGVILVSTRDPVSEPFLNFLVEVNWPAGRLVREYTLLLDPPVFDQAPVAPAPVTPPRSVPRALPVAAPRPAAAVVQAPQRAGTPRSTAPASDVRPQNIRSQMDAATQHYVGVHDTLWNVALKTRPDKSVSAQQMMVAIQRLNPDAFVNNNINRLKSGVVLDIPTFEQIRQFDVEDSVREVQRQNQLWKGGASDSGANDPKPEQLDGSKQRSSGPAVPGAEAGEAQLRIVGAPGDALKDAKAGLTSSNQATDNQVTEIETELLAKNQELEEQLVVALEGLDKVERDNAELFDRLESLSEQMEAMQRLIVLKDQQMAQLQSQASREQQAEQSGPGELEKPAEPVAQAAPVEPLPVPSAAQSETEVEQAQAVSWVQKLLQTPAYLAAAGAGLIALLAGLLVILKRRERSHDDDADEAAVQAAMADLEQREAEQKGPEEKGQASPVAAVSELDTLGEDGASVAEPVDAEDPFHQLSDAEDVLSGADEDVLNDLSMDLGLDEPGAVEDDFTSSLLSDDDFDLGSGDGLPEELDYPGAVDSEADRGRVEETDEDDAVDELAISVDDLEALAGVSEHDGEEVGSELDFILDGGAADVASSGDVDAADGLDADSLDDGLDFVINAVDASSGEQSDAGVEDLSSAADEALQDELSLDLESAAPTQSLDDLEADLSEALDFDMPSENPASVDAGLPSSDEMFDLEAEAELKLDTVAEVAEDESEEFDNELEALFAIAEDQGEEEPEPAFMSMALEPEHDQEPEQEAEPEVADSAVQSMGLDTDGTEEVPEVEPELKDEALESGLSLEDAFALELDAETVAADTADLAFNGSDLEEVDAEPASAGSLDGGLSLESDVAELEIGLEDSLDIEAAGGAAASALGLEGVEAGEGLGAAEAESGPVASLFDELMAESESDARGVAAVAVDPEPLSTSDAPAAGAELDTEALFGLDQADEEALEAELNAMLEEEGNALTLEESESVEEAFGEDFLSETDEVGTKLDLARAYIDMDDRDGALDILQEVVREGNEQQAGEAKQLLETLGE